MPPSADGRGFHLGIPQLARLMQGLSIFTAEIPPGLRLDLLASYVFKTGSPPPGGRGALVQAISSAEPPASDIPALRSAATAEVVSLSSAGVPIALPVLPPSSPSSCCFCGHDFHSDVHLHHDYRVSSTRIAIQQGPVVFTQHGITKGLLFRRSCSNTVCNALLYATYTSRTGRTGDCGVHVHSSFFETGDFFISTTDTVFTIELLLQQERLLLHHTATFKGCEASFNEQFVFG